jgi:hypothetical protein
MKSYGGETGVSPVQPGGDARRFTKKIDRGNNKVCYGNCSNIDIGR